MSGQRRGRRWAAALAALALGGCVVGPRYATPPTPGLAGGPFISAPSAATVNAPIPARWWRLYDDPVLDDLVQRAMTRNQDLKVAAANLAYAQGLLDEARVGRYPATQLYAAPSYGEAVAAAPSKLTYAAGFLVTYQLDLFGQIRRTIESASANADAVAAAQDATRVTVAGETASAYANLCGFGRQIAVAKASLGLVQQTYDLTRAQRDAGALSDLDVEREAVLVEQSRAAISPLERQRRAALYTLAALIGGTPSEVPAAAAACATPPRISRPLPTGDGAALLRRRPDLRQAERQFAALTAKIGVATSELYPTVTLGAGGGAASGSLSGLVNNPATTFGIGSNSSSIPALISWTFPNVLAASAHIKEARAQASGALASFDSAVLTALKEAETALAAYSAELNYHAALTAAQSHADEALRLAQVQYRAGGYSFLDLLQAQSTALAADQAVAASDQQISLDQVAVFQALGGGWEDAPRVTPASIDGETPQIR